MAQLQKVMVEVTVIEAVPNMFPLQSTCSPFSSHMPILLEPVKFTGILSNLFPCNIRIDISQHEDDTNFIGTSQCTSNLSNLFS